MGESVMQRVADTNKREKNNNKAFWTRKKAKIVERIYCIWGNFFKARQEIYSVRRFRTTSPLLADLQIDKTLAYFTRM